MKPLFELTEVQVILFFNGAILAALFTAYYWYFREAFRRKFPLATWLTFIAVVNTLMVVGTRVGGFSYDEWCGLLFEGSFPVHRDQTLLAGLLIAFPAALLLNRWWRMPVQTGDALLIGFPLVLVLGRVGCVAAGCCFGTASDLPWSMSFGPHSDIYQFQLKTGLIGNSSAGSLPVHPVQLYDILGNLLVFFLAWHLRNRWRNAGSLMWFSVSALMLARFGTEFFRDPITDRGELNRIFLGLKMAQWAPLVFALPSLFMLWRNERKIRPGTSKVFKARPAILLASILLGLSALMFLCRNGLAFLEFSVLLVSFGTAWMALAVQWWREYRPGAWVRLLPAGVMSFGALLVVVESRPDSIAPFKIVPQTHWMEFSGGYNNMEYTRLFLKGQSDCGPTYDRYRRNISSGTADISYHSRYAEGQERYFGLRATAGHLQNSDSSSLGADFYAISPYAGVEDRLVGVYGGLRFNQWSSDPEEFRYTNSFPYLYAGLRLGALHSYYFNAAIGGVNGLNFYPEPRWQIGLANFGCFDRTGTTSIGLGIAGFEDLGSFYLTGKYAFLHKRLQVSGTVYAASPGSGYVLGLSYRTAPKAKPAPVRQ